MNRKQVFAIAATAVVLAGLSGTGGYWLAKRVHPQTGIAPEKSERTQTGIAPEKSERKVLYWYDPMAPTQHFDKPGKSPFMDMELLPKYADEGDAGGGVRIDPLLTQNTGVKFATVETGRLGQGVEAVASVGFNERLVAIVQARTAGIVERVYARAANDVIPAGAPLADVRVPEWYGAQAEYLALKKTGDAGIAAAARAPAATWDERSTDCTDGKNRRTTSSGDRFLPAEWRVAGNRCA